jgi:hypothetical protein
MSSLYTIVASKTLDNSIFTNARPRARYGVSFVLQLLNVEKKFALKNFVAGLLLRKMFNAKYFHMFFFNTKISRFTVFVTRARVPHGRYWHSSEQLAKDLFLCCVPKRLSRGEFTRWRSKKNGPLDFKTYLDRRLS